MYDLTKLAASFDAQRNKQYWQMLKRMYGGSDEAVAAIKETGDTGIYHGTKPENVNPILDQGLLSRKSLGMGMYEGQGQKYGEGIYFGSKEMANRYGKYGDNSLVRLKKPSELAGTKELYPNPSNMMKIDNAVEDATDESKSVLYFNIQDRVFDEYGGEPARRLFTTVGKERFKSPGKEQFREMYKKIKGEEAVMRDNYPMFDQNNPSNEAVKMRYFAKTKDNEIAIDPVHQHSFLSKSEIPPNLLKRGE